MLQAVSDFAHLTLSSCENERRISTHKVFSVHNNRNNTSNKGQEKNNTWASYLVGTFAVLLITTFQSVKTRTICIPACLHAS